VEFIRLFAPRVSAQDLKSLETATGETFSI
jgi:hypothetical protein